MRTRDLLAVLGLTLVCSCSPGTGEGGGESEGSRTDGSTEGEGETNGDGDGDGEGEGDGDGEGDTNDDAELCACEAGQICVGDCAFSDFGPDSVTNRRCIDAEPCVGVDPYNAPCITEACGSPYASVMSCGPSGAHADVDVLCAMVYPRDCDEFIHDCPEDEKCVFHIPSSELYPHSHCEWVDGMDAAGDPCSSEGQAPFDSHDSCDASSMCWGGAPIAEPFEGICHPYCTGSVDEPICPDGMSCELIEGRFHLCM